MNREALEDFKEALLDFGKAVELRPDAIEFEIMILDTDGGPISRDTEDLRDD
ncbi:MAG: hypothetical protein WCP85_27280 [Mariniphaga sp.]